MNIEEKIKNRIKDIGRICSISIFPILRGLGVYDFYFAGGMFKQLTIKGLPSCDFDIFPITTNYFNIQGAEFVNNLKILKDEYKIDYFINDKTATITYFQKDGPIKIQFCDYKRDSLEKLIDSFDFSYCQAGAQVSIDVVKNVYFTEKYCDHIINGSVCYTGSEYPLSSLIRLAKLYKNELICGYQYRKLLLQIIIDIVKRGFFDLGDLKEQLGAVDLAYILDDDFDIDSFLNVFPPKVGENSLNAKKV